MLAIAAAQPRCRDGGLNISPRASALHCILVHISVLASIFRKLLYRGSVDLKFLRSN
jgi:hypothetical protein